MSNFIKTNLYKNLIFVNYRDSHDILFVGSNGSFNHRTSEIKNIKSNSKIFFNGENLKRFLMFSDEFLQDTFDLIIDFKETNIEKKYIKFPLWLCFYWFL